ncbi:hypothetical protein D3C72_2169120 [compost metagenome]
MPIEPVRIHPVPQLAVKHVARRLARQIVQIRKLPEQALGHLGERNGFFDIHVLGCLTVGEPLQLHAAATMRYRFTACAGIRLESIGTRPASCC